MRAPLRGIWTFQSTAHSGETTFASSRDEIFEGSKPVRTESHTAGQPHRSIVWFSGHLAAAASAGRRSITWVQGAVRANLRPPLSRVRLRPVRGRCARPHLVVPGPDAAERDAREVRADQRRLRLRAPRRHDPDARRREAPHRRSSCRRARSRAPILLTRTPYDADRRSRRTPRARTSRRTSTATTTPSTSSSAAGTSAWCRTCAASTAPRATTS